VKQQPNNDLKAILAGNTAETPPTEPEPEVKALEEKKSKRNPKREGKKVCVTFVNKNTHKQLKLLAIEKEMNMEDLFSESLELYLEMHNRKPIA
jgi:hypothetical protein